jgi:hypothetical protein
MLFDALFDAWDTLESLSPENFSLEQPPRDTTSVEDLIPWHIFEVVYELQVPVSSPRSERVDLGAV